MVTIAQSYNLCDNMKSGVVVVASYDVVCQVGRLRHLRQPPFGDAKNEQPPQVDVVVDVVDGQQVVNTSGRCIGPPEVDVACSVYD